MKTKILTILKERSGFVSGQALCGQLGVSRTAVWKVIRQLEEEGYVIEAVRNKGYRLVETADVMTEAEIGSLIRTERMGKRLVYLPQTDSTNIQARRLGQEEGTPGEELVFSCREQYLHEPFAPPGYPALQRVHDHAGGRNGGEPGCTGDDRTSGPDQMA